MKKIKVSSILGRTTVQSSFDLVFLSYLGKFLNEKGFILDFSNCSFDFTYEELKHSHYFTLIGWAACNGYFTGISSKAKLFTDINDYNVDDIQFPIHIFNPLTKGLNFEYSKMPEVAKKQLETKVGIEDRIYDFMGAAVTNRALFWEANLETAYVACMAKLTAEIIANGKLNIRAFFVVADGMLRREHGLSLLTYTVLEIAFPNQFCNISCSSNIISLTQLKYQAWRASILDVKLQTRYTPEEKYVFAKKHYSIGDIITLYHRVPTEFTSSKMDAVDSVRLAVVRKLNNDGVTIEYINTNTTRTATNKKFEEVSQEVRDLYLGDPDFGVRKFARTYSWSTIGVDWLLSNDDKSEEFFFTRLNNTGTTEQLITKGKKVVLEKMSWANAARKIFNDYNIEYNKNRFKYFYGDGTKQLR